MIFGQPFSMNARFYQGYDCVVPGKQKMRSLIYKITRKLH